MGASKACIFLFTIHLVYSITAQEVVRRVPQGFLGMRGKKNYDFGTEFYKRKPQFFVGVKGKKELNDMYFKRAPMGFVGMRGKKDDYPDINFKDNNNYDLFTDMSYKRAPMGFVGMRGKKDLIYPDFIDDKDMNDLNSFTDLDYKRAPLGFVGMRGKKDFSNPSSSEMDYKRAPMGFVGMRGKKEYSNYLSSEMGYKRAPMGFVGMRGKKEFDDSTIDGNNVNEFSDMDYKRAPMGFVGMRGKKELYPNVMMLPERSGSLIGQIDYSTEDDGQKYPILIEVINEYLHKLRSKANTETTTEAAGISDERVNEVEKRATLHKFYGVRGKKSVQGKRPYDVSFRGKFIGVRGKKDLKNQEAQEIRFLLPQPWQKKRAGFQGMRGRKWTDENSGPDAEQGNEVVIPT